ncbi:MULTISPECIES: LLM class flavin-dependent oxidoreductase [unclassified Frankia]|uniref:LLM class flavin-dependent oxidoreductase n=1 Tax=unclassified Frankia TaxID=2632575 RepID=UPI004043B799
MITVGLDVHESILSTSPRQRRDLLGRAQAAGLDHVVVADHVSFYGGRGFDGLVSATAALTSNDDLPVLLGVYQLALRHPMTVARQLASVSQLAPGRLILGVGVGGEDRSEPLNCGVDPSTRGRRLDESLRVLRALASGEAVDHSGEFFELKDARVLPAPQPRIPIVIGGSSAAAVRRTVRFGDGWLGIFCSARRFAATREQIAEVAQQEGRPLPSWYGLNLWCGIDAQASRARQLVAERMERLYHLPYEKFERLAPAGTPQQVGEWLLPYLEAGCEHLTLVATSTSWEAGVEHTAEVKRYLLEHAPA